MPAPEPPDRELEAPEGVSSEASGLKAFRAEAGRRLGPECRFEATRDAGAYRILVERRGRRAQGALKTPFFDSFAASGGVDNCHCVEHFFEHLLGQLDE